MGDLGGLRSVLLVLAVLVVMLLALPGPIDGQVLYGSLVGNVTDTSGGVVPGVAVTVIHLGLRVSF